MTSKRWMLVVTELGSTAPVRHATVDAANWMVAIKEGRRLIGEPPTVPAGSSCQVAPDGKVTVHAPMERQSYLLYPEGSPAAAEVAHLQESPPAAPPLPKRERSRTMAYVPETPIAAPAAAPPAPRPRPKTMAYIPAVELPQGSAASREIAIGPAAPTAAAQPPTPAAQPPGPPPPPRAAPAAARPPHREPPRTPSEAAYELLSARDEAPSAESPLHYRERSFAAPAGTSQAEAESIARAGLRSLQLELADAPQGQLLHVAVYDHKWRDRPSRPALVALEWKDWRDELSVQYPLAELASSMSAPAMLGRASERLELRQRLAIAGEAASDLGFLTSPAEAITFATRLLEELACAPVVAGCLYDMRTNALQVCAERGTRGRVGTQLPRSRGLLAAAADELGAVLHAVDPRRDPRYDASVDAAPGVEPARLMWVPVAHKGDLLGMLQLVGPVGTERLAADDAEVAGAIAQQVGESIHRMHLRSAARQRG